MDIPSEYDTATTVNGRRVIIYTREAGGDYPIHGAYWNNKEWVISAWTIDGYKFIGKDEDKPIRRSGMDLLLDMPEAA